MARESGPASLFASTLSAEPVNMWGRIKALNEEDVYDRLTGLYNPRHLAITFHMELSRARRFARTLSVALFDIDRLKSINTAQGRERGNRVLAEVGRMIGERPREYDLAFRLNEDAFLLVLPETARDGARRVTEDLVAAIGDQSFGGLPAGTVTVSGGCGEVRVADKTEGLHPLLERAQVGQVQALSEGGNRVFEF